MGELQENKIERYLINMMVSYREVEKNLWIIEDEPHSLNGVVVLLEPPVVIIRVLVMKAPKENRLPLFTKLLELNSSDLVHGAYALEGDDIVLIDTLEYDTMDYEEFRASLEAISLALTQHYPILSQSVSYT
ncbi:MAG: YbjN domain-containing protein, partial [Treponemataceae bacterium]|nr:YbjN domain-containing protein [Treponemataceae bacterium]